MKTKLFFRKHIVLVLVFIANLFFAQEVAPDVSRFLQVNTFNGGKIAHVSTSNNDEVYICGRDNGKSFDFDNYTVNPVGTNDLFIIKTNSSGYNKWMRSVNAGTKGSIYPSKSYINPAGDVCVTASFVGTVNFAGKTMSSTNGGYLIVSFDKDGKEKWISQFTALPNDIAFSDVQAYVIVGNTKALWLSDTDGALISSRDFTSNNLYLTSVEAYTYSNNGNNFTNIYLGGYSKTNVTVDTFSLLYRVGFVLKTDTSFKLNSVLQFAKNTTSTAVTYTSVVYDTKILNDGSLAIVAYSNDNAAVKINSGSLTASSNSSSFTSPGDYILTAKVSNDLSNLQWYRNSSRVDNSGYFSTATLSNVVNLEIVPQGSKNSANNFRVLFRKKLASNYTNNFTLPNGNTINNNGYVVFNNEYTDGKANANVKDVSGYSESLNYVSNSSLTKDYFLGYGTDSQALFVSDFDGGWYKTQKSNTFGSISSQYIKHIGTDGSLVSLTNDCGKVNFLGKSIENGLKKCSKAISRISPSGQVDWLSKVDNVLNENVSYTWATNRADTSKNKETAFLALSGDSPVTFTDNAGTTTTLSQSTTRDLLIINTTESGTLKWYNKLQFPIDTSLDLVSNTYEKELFSITYDNDGNLYLAGTSVVAFSNNGTTYNQSRNEEVFLAKFDATTGQLLFLKEFYPFQATTLLLESDDENNVYLLAEAPKVSNFIDFGNGIQVALPTDFVTSNIFVKFNSSGNALAGTNYYKGNTNSDRNYSWPISMKFDGKDLILSGELYSYDNVNYKGIDGKTYTGPYTPNVTDYIAKVDKSLKVVWHSPIYSNYRMSQNKIDVDENGDLYYYAGVLGNVNIDNVETVLSTTSRTALLMKFSGSAGTSKYIKNLGTHNNQLNNASLSVLKNNILSLSGNILKQDTYIYPLNNYDGDNYYIATFGVLPTPYLTPEKDYLIVKNIDLPNTSITNNTGNFNLITNVAWNATSDQSWLTLGKEALSGKVTPSSTVNGVGDQKLLMYADQNTSGITRTAQITIVGDNVGESKITVTQEAQMGSAEVETSVLVVYPNPFDNEVFIKSTNQKIQKVIIYDLSGKLLKTFEVNNLKEYKIIAQGLPSGMCMMSIVTDKGKQTYKIIKK